MLFTEWLTELLVLFPDWLSWLFHLLLAANLIIFLGVASSLSPSGFVIVWIQRRCDEGEERLHVRKLKEKKRNKKQQREKRREKNLTGENWIIGKSKRRGDHREKKGDERRRGSGERQSGERE